MGFTGKTNDFLNAFVENDGFFPRLNLGDFQRVYRVPAEFETETVVAHVQKAMLQVNHDLNTKKQAWLNDGYLSLEAVPGGSLGALKNVNLFYERAVFCYAKAELLAQFVSMIRRDEAENLAKSAPDERTYWLAQSREATRAILGITHVTVELM